MVKLKVNGKEHVINVPGNTPLLWVLRENLALTGTKYGCGMSLCGACTVHIDGKAARSCVTSVADVEGKEIVTIEGLPPAIGEPLRTAWLEEEVSACGYCQPGQLMSAAVLLAEKPQPQEADIDEAMSGNLCRCGTYGRIRRAIAAAVRARQKEVAK